MMRQQLFRQSGAREKHITWHVSSCARKPPPPPRQISVQQLQPAESNAAPEPRSWTGNESKDPGVNLLYLRVFKMEVSPSWESMYAVLLLSGCQWGNVIYSC